jgi:hypothetical protein
LIYYTVSTEINEMVTIPGFLSDPSQLPPLTKKTQRVTMFLCRSLVEQERHAFVAVSVALHPYNADLAERLKTVRVITHFSTQEWIPVFAEMTDGCGRDDGHRWQNDHQLVIVT